MRSLWLIVLVLMLSVGIANADPVDVGKIGLPNVQGGLIYSVERESVEACTTATLLGYPTKIGTFELRGGYIIEQTPIGALVYKVGDLTQFGLEQPLLGLLDVSVGVYAGYDFATAEDDDGKFDWGLMATIVEAKF